MDLSNVKFVALLSALAFLIMFLIAIACFIYQLNDLRNVTAPGALNIQQRVGQEVQESSNRKDLEKMQKFRKEALNEKIHRAKPRSTVWITEDVPDEADAPRAKDTSLQVSMLYQDEVDSGVLDMMDSIKMDLGNKGKYFNGPENWKNLRTIAVKECRESFDTENTKLQIIY